MNVRRLMCPPRHLMRGNVATLKSKLSYHVGIGPDTPNVTAPWRLSHPPAECRIWVKTGKAQCEQMFSALPLRDGVIGRPSLWIAEDFWVLRFRLMVKRGPSLWRPQASEGEAQHGPFCWTGRFSQGDECLHCE